MYLTKFYGKDPSTTCPHISPNKPESSSTRHYITQDKKTVRQAILKVTFVNALSRSETTWLTITHLYFDELYLLVELKKEILAAESESLGCYTQSHYFEVGKLRDNITTWYVPEFIYTISGEILRRFRGF